MRKYTKFDKSEVLDGKILPLVQELKRICNREQMPMYVSVCYKNDGRGTTYYNDIISSKISDVVLKQDLITDYLNVQSGFTTIPPEDKIELNFTSTEKLSR